MRKQEKVIQPAKPAANVAAAETISRVLVLGDENSGRTGLIRSFTAGVPQFKVRGMVSQKAGDNLQIIDSSPIEGVKLDLKAICRKAQPQVILLCVDLSEGIANNAISKWENELHGIYGEYKFVVVGTKADIAHSESKDALRKIIQARGGKIPYLECSAKTGKNIHAVFDKVRNPAHEKPQAERPDWTEKRVVVTVSGMEPFLQEFEKKGTTISSFAAGLANPEFASVTGMKMDKQGAEELTAKMTASGSTITIKIDAPSAASQEGRKVEITDKNAHGDSLKEIKTVVQDMMQRCEAVASRLGEVQAKVADTGQVVGSNPVEKITIDTSKSTESMRPAADTVIKMAGYTENLQETKQQHAAAKAFESNASAQKK